MQVTTEVLDGTIYYSAEDARGNVTTMFAMGGTAFVMTNRSPARALVDIKKRSAAVTAILRAACL